MSLMCSQGLEPEGSKIKYGSHIPDQLGFWASDNLNLTFQDQLPGGVQTLSSGAAGDVVGTDRK